MNMILERTDYYKWLKEQPDICHFCDYQNTGTLIKEMDGWVWTVSISPVWKWHTMLYPKRHVVEIDQLNSSELVMMITFYRQIIEQYRQLDKEGKFGTPFLKYEMLWRTRDSYVDTVTGNIKPSHFHLNIYPFRDHHTDPVMDRDAYLYDFRDLLK